MKKIIGFLFKFLFIILIIAAITILGFGIYALTVLKTPFDKNIIYDTNLTIEVFNQQNLMLDEPNTFNTTKISLNNVAEHTKQAFISIEDKDFYKHNGISVKRMGKAFLKNLSQMRIVEGASTISQQLIKNTFLTNEKTYARKLNEISLAMELEKNFNKDQILENYLNVIYFGNNCYGIENASLYYFSKSASQLSISESATLAAIIKSPSKYSPIKNPENCLKRRNLVLREMQKDGYITKEELLEKINSSINLQVCTTIKNKLNSYSQATLDEAVEILKMPEKQIAIAEYKIYTYQNLDRQIKLDNILQQNKNNLQNKDFSLIDIHPKTGGVLAYVGKSDYKLLDYKRQPASAIKPLLVYAPAINEDIINPATLLLDENISIDGYSPQNVGGQFHGYVSAREALSKSLNIPAVKIASYLGLNKMQHYAKKLDIPLDNKDLNYSLALGGMTYGTNLKELTGAYSALANNGHYTSPKFIDYITNSEGKVVYRNRETQTKVFRDDTAFLATNMLKTCAQSGTAKKLNELNFEIAAKTGTVGNSKGNTDAYCISYTTQNILGVWLGRMDNKLIDTAGGNLPTILARDYYSEVYKNNNPSGFLEPSSVTKVDVDLYEYENNHNVVIANSLTPPRFKFSEYFSRFNLPQDKAKKFLNAEPANLNAYIKNNVARLSFLANDYLTYEVYRIINNKPELFKTISGQKGLINLEDEIKENEKVSYYIITKLVSFDGLITISEEKSNVVNLFNLKTTTSETHKEKWYI